MRAYKIRRIFDPAAEGQGTFVIEFECESLERFRACRRDAALVLQCDSTERYEGRFTASRRVMEIVE